MKQAMPIRTLIIIVVALLFFTPLWWMLVSGLRPTDSIFKFLSPISAYTFWPDTWTWENIVGVWESPLRLAIWNSIVVSVVTVVVGLVVCSMAAFALAVVDFPFRRGVFALMVLSFLIPFDAIAVPLLSIMQWFGLNNSHAGLILPGIGNGLAVFLLRQFFLGIPKQLCEAAIVDGMGWFGIYLRIYLPLSIPALISAALILFLFQWQAYLWPLLVAPAPEYKVAAVAIAQLSNAMDAHFSYGLVFAGASFIALIPMLVLTLLQRYYSVSIAATGGKE